MNEARSADQLDWDGFVTWAAALAQSRDIQRDENDWKLKSVERLARAREALLKDDPTALDEIRRALGASGLLSQYYVMAWAQSSQEHPERLAHAVASFWTADIETADLDRLAEELRAVPMDRVTPGNATAVGSVLLMARDPYRFPPYRTEAVRLAMRLSGSSASIPSSAQARYAAFLAWLDDFLAQAEVRGLSIPDRLTAQGIAWTVTQMRVGESGLDPGQQEAFRRWRGDEPEPQRAWLARGSKATVADWLANGYVSLAATYLGAVPAGTTLKGVKAAVESGYQHVDYSQRKALTEEYHAFLTAMHPGDIVAAQSDDTLHVGLVTGFPDYVETGGDRLRREVEWQQQHAVGALEPPLPGLLDLQGSLVDITQGLDALRTLVSVVADEESPTPASPPLLVEVVPALAPATDKLAASLFMERGPVQDMLDLLQSRQQIVLYGPPGTGKTFIAMTLARHMVGPEDRSRVQLVQFHPSYAYEDFFEGFRPTETEQGAATFELTPGPLRRIAAEAKANPTKPYVLVIDELNRANLAKVFGELYFLLEYRNESIQLQYNPTEAFRLPRNLFFIGTMNTADRSIALLDAAMRRRFSFVELHPDDLPVRDVLRNWLAANHQPDDRARLLSALNEAIEEQDRDMRIGPSYLMRPGAESEAGLDRVWRFDILPLLEEHYYGRLTREQVRARFGLEALRAPLSQEHAATSGAEWTGHTTASAPSESDEATAAGIETEP